MNNFKKILLSVSILTTINIFSTNCFAMKENKTTKCTVPQQPNYNKNNEKIPKNEINNNNNIINLNIKENASQSNDKYLNKKRKLENETEKEEIEKDDIFKKPQHNKKIFGCEKVPKNEINSNNNIINLNKENTSQSDDKYLNKKRKLENKTEKDEIEKDDIFKKPQHNKNNEKISENEINNNNNIINLNKEKELNLFEDVLDEERLLKERYKKYIILRILVNKMSDQLKEIVSNYDSKYDKNMTNGVYKIIMLTPSSNLKIPNLKKQLIPCEFVIDLKPDDIESWQGNKAEENFFSYIMSNYKIIIGKAIEQTMYFFKNLTEESCNEIINKEEIKDKFDFIFNQTNLTDKEKILEKFNKSIFEELKNINKKDLCFKYFTNMKALIDSIMISISEENKRHIKYATIITGERLKTSTQIEIPSSTELIIFSSKKDSFKTYEKRTITFNEYDFLNNLQDF